ncbi:MAG: hypothetical protein CMJ81_23750 [Planctomycetaceae bacterium]|nr:hypothetical protein [Planctomycetaceae bacterium]MBP61791.1 hypothetical protein [Planctomycetaceae bacterium]
MIIGVTIKLKLPVTKDLKGEQDCPLSVPAETTRGEKSMNDHGNFHFGRRDLLKTAAGGGFCRPRRWQLMKPRKSHIRPLRAGPRTVYDRHST